MFLSGSLRFSREQREKGSGFCVKPLNRGQAHGGIKAARLGGEGLVLLAGAGWRSKSPSRGCPCLHTAPQPPVRAWVLLCLAPCCPLTSRSPRAGCPAASALYPLVLPLQVWIYSDQLAWWWVLLQDEGKEELAAACWVGGRICHARLGTALSQKDKNIRSQNDCWQILVLILLDFLSAFCCFFLSFVLDGCMCENSFSGFRFNQKKKEDWLIKHNCRWKMAKLSC